MTCQKRKQKPQEKRQQRFLLFTDVHGKKTTTYNVQFYTRFVFVFQETLSNHFWRAVRFLRSSGATYSFASWTRNTIAFDLISSSTTWLLISIGSFWVYLLRLASCTYKSIDSSLPHLTSPSSENQVCLFSFDILGRANQSLYFLYIPSISSHCTTWHLLFFERIDLWSWNVLLLDRYSLQVCLLRLATSLQLTITYRNQVSYFLWGALSSLIAIFKSIRAFKLFLEPSLSSFRFLGLSSLFSGAFLIPLQTLRLTSSFLPGTFCDYFRFFRTFFDRFSFRLERYLYLQTDIFCFFGIKFTFSAQLIHFRFFLFKLIYFLGISSFDFRNKFTYRISLLKRLLSFSLRTNKFSPPFGLTLYPPSSWNSFALWVYLL